MSKISYIKSLCLGAIMLFAGISANAQQIETSVFINATLPVAQFNNPVNLEPFGSFVIMDRSQIGKGAAAGLGATARFGLWFDVGVGELQPYAEVGLLWNNSGSKIRKLYDNNADSLKNYPTAPQYLNVPIMLGLKYRYNLTPDLRPFAELAIGYDLLFITKNGYPSQTYRYKATGELTWMAGIGTYLGEHVSVNLFYMGLGNHYIEYSKRSAEAPEESFTERPSSRLGAMGLRVGFHF
jgi:hypothetical protein